jgi:hypothetical protein
VQSADQAAPPPPGRLFAYASADGGMTLPRPSLGTNPAALPSYSEDGPATAPEADEEHPGGELTYVPFETASLMTDVSVSYSRTIAPMIHPDQTNLDYLFADMDHPTALTLRKTSGYHGLADAQRFSGEAVKSLYAEMEPPSPTRLAQNTN